MCRHLAYLGPQRSLSSLLYEPEQSLEKQSHAPRHQRDGAMNADGWGVGWWDPTVTAVPARYRTARPMWADVSFRSVADVVHADAITAAARSATPPLPVVETGNAPFSSGEWLFSLNGFIIGFASALGEELRRSVSPARSIDIQGTTDSEVLFALVLDALDDGANPGEALEQVTVDALSRAEGYLNMLLTDGRHITASACGNSLFSLLDAGLAADGVLVASEPLDDDTGWTRVPDGSVVRASVGSLEITPMSTPKGST